MIKSLFKKLFELLPYFILIAVTMFISYYVYRTFDNNLKIYDSISTGIISGIITAILFFVIQIIWRKNIVVWIENLLYQDVCVEGEWSGILVPFVGLDTIDKMQKDMAWKAFRQKLRKEAKEERQVEQEEVQEAEVVTNPEETAEQNQEVKAEIVIHDPKKKKDSEEQNGEKKNSSRTEFTISPQPIVIRAEIRRAGHNISGRIIELGGASKTYSYNIQGTFKNLILAGTYETFSKDHMDRGAFSLMLLENGKKLEGFFSSYSDGEHRISPMQCILRKRHINNSDEK